MHWFLIIISEHLAEYDCHYKTTAALLIQSVGLRQECTFYKNIPSTYDRFGNVPIFLALGEDLYHRKAFNI